VTVTTTVPVHYKSGGTWGQCPVCSFVYRLNDMRMRWDGLRVCNADWDPLPDTFIAPSVTPEGLVRPDANPKMPDVFISGNGPTPGDL
jgi:hypothetical protein